MLKRLILTLSIVAGLQACGGATASSTSEPPVGGAADGYSKGSVTIRDVSGASGGSHGYVNTASFVKTITGKFELAFEWASLAILDNNSEHGENVAFYAQGNKLSSGPTWGLVGEVADTSGLGGGAVAAEFDVWVTGPDNGSRIGLDVLVGDAARMRGTGQSAQAGATAGLRIGSTTSSPYASWGTGIILQGVFRDAVLTVLDPAGRPIFQIMPNGDIYKNGIKVL